MIISNASNQNLDGLHIRDIRLPFLGLLVIFLTFTFLSQALFNLSRPLSVVFFALSVLVIFVQAIFGSRNDLFLFLFTVISMRITIPFASEKEIELVLPTFFFVISVVRFYPKFSHVSAKYLHPLLFAVVFFFGFCLVGIFYRIQIPGINAIGNNSGLLSRFNLYNSIITFLTVMLLFDHRFVRSWINYAFKFNLLVFCVAAIIMVLGLGAFPLFNSFTWSIIVETAESKKIIVLGTSAVFILAYALCFVRRPLNMFLLIAVSFLGMLLSGSRISFVAGVSMLFFAFVVRKGFLGKSFVILALLTIVGYKILLSPIILLVPEKYQRLVIIFPSEYYEGKLREFRNSAAAASTSFRFDIWNRAAKKISKQPLIGNGFDVPQANYDFSTSSVLSMYQKIPTEILHGDFVRTGNLHNTFISIAYLLGVPAAVLFLYIFLRLIWRHYKWSIVLRETHRSVALFITAILINYMIFALISDLVFDLEFFVLLAIALKTMIFYYNSPVENIEPESGKNSNS